MKYNCFSISIFTDISVDLLVVPVYHERDRKGDVEMSSVVSAIRDTVPISQFNRGLAGKIFSDVKAAGAKVVIKNNVAEAVIVPPDEYVQIMDNLNDYYLLTMAVERIGNFDPSKLISLEEMDKRLGISESDLNGQDEVDFE